MRPATIALMLLPLAGTAAATTIFADGFESACIDGLDTDADLLSDCFELALQTDPGHADTDRDGLKDGDELFGVADGPDLPSFGVDPRHRDLLVEIDWMAGPECGPGFDRRPTAANIAQAQAVFANAPVANPDGTTGIRLFVDYGQGGAATGGNAIPGSDALLSGKLRESDSEFRAVRQVHFTSERNGYFHYAVFAWRYEHALQASTGEAEIGGDDVIVTMGCMVNAFLGETNYTNTFVHELGHNLGLQHGGDNACNYKPNYDSVMNYRYQLDGNDADCDGHADHIVGDFSHGLRPPLDESHVDESQGMCNRPIDWNHDGLIQTDATIDLNSEATQQGTYCGGVHTVLQDHDDWSAIRLDVLPSVDGGAPQPETATCALLPG